MESLAVECTQHRVSHSCSVCYLSNITDPPKSTDVYNHPKLAVDKTLETQMSSLKDSKVLPRTGPNRRTKAQNLAVECPQHSVFHSCSVYCLVHRIDHPNSTDVYKHPKLAVDSLRPSPAKRIAPEPIWYSSCAKEVEVFSKR